MPLFSIIVPVFNRRSEVEELLESLSLQTDKDFETIIVEDGSTDHSEDIAKRYEAAANVRYFMKKNEGRSAARNYGMARAEGEWLIFFDSDCVIPPTYFEIVKREVERGGFDCFGGPDAAADNFTTLQKAINYSMTSFLTTGGIRGRKKGMEKFLPRTFNMGFTQEVYKKAGDFRDVFGEDIDLSLRIRKAGFNTVLLPEAFVYHKRRNTIRSFSRQMLVFGRSRVELHLLHPGSMKLVHLLPTAFMLGSIFLILATIFCKWAILPLGIYYLALFIEALCRTRSIKVSLLALVTATIQLWGYSIGFMRSYVKEVIFKMRTDKEREMKRLKFK